MAAALPFVAMAATAGGKIFEGVETNNAYRRQAATDDENARLSVLQGEQQSLQTRRDERQQAGDMLAGMGGAGVQLGTGSAADVLAESAFQRELEIFNIRTQAAGKARDLQRQAADARKAGKAALIGSVFGAVSSALNSASAMRAGGKVDAATAGSRAPVPRMAMGG